MKIIKGTVVKGFITRYDKRTEWEDELVMIPIGEVACDADAIPHYKLREGKFYEYYGWEECSAEDPIYLPVDFVE